MIMVPEVRQRPRPHLPAPQRPAPLPGADTRLICHDLLAMDADEIDRLITEGVLFTPAENSGVPL